MSKGFIATLVIVAGISFLTPFHAQGVELDDVAQEFDLFDKNSDGEGNALQFDIAPDTPFAVKLGQAVLATLSAFFLAVLIFAILSIDAIRGFWMPSYGNTKAHRLLLQKYEHKLKTMGGDDEIAVTHDKALLIAASQIGFLAGAFMFGAVLAFVGGITLAVVL